MRVAWATRVATLTTIKIQTIPWLRLCSNSCCGTTLALSWLLGAVYSLLLSLSMKIPLELS